MRRAHAIIALFMLASAGSGVVSPRSTDSPFVAMNATSTCRRSSGCSPPSSTAAIVRPRTRPPIMITVTFGRAASSIASGGELTTTISSRSAGIASAKRRVVEPASSRIAPSSGSSASAALAIRSFSAVITASRADSVGSKPSRSTGMAPPCTRRTCPARSRTVRSRRTVSVVTP